MAWDYDKLKAQMFFTHLVRASNKFEETHMAKTDLADSLKKISKFNVNKEFKKEIKDLKNKIDTLMDKQMNVITAHKKKKDYNVDLKSKISILEKKLSQYIEDKKKKNKRIIELEEKVKAKQQKQQVLSTIKGELEGLETIYHNLKESGHLTPQQLQKLENKISLLKLKLEKK